MIFTRFMKTSSKRLLSLVLVSVFLGGEFVAQEYETETTLLETEQTSDEENDGKKHWISAFGGMLIFNVGLATYNRYAIGSGWAQTGPDEWNRFWERSLAWDDDWYWTNFVLHPYQGSLYYMSARGSNLNVAESLLVTTIGSAFWEYLCETNAPSKNDMVYTTLGAFSVGEMMYRLSLAADSKSRLAGFALNPMRLWTEFATGQKPKNPHGNIHELTLRLNAGTTQGYTNILGSDPKVDKSHFENRENYPIHGGLELYAVYNDPYTNDSNTPYSQFELRINANAGKGSGQGSDCNYKTLDENMMYNILIESNGMLWSRSPVFADNIDTTLGLVMEYDFDWHSFYLISSLAPGLAIKQRINLEKSRFEWQLHGAWIALGTADNYYLRRSALADWPDGTIRFYSFTTGAESVLKLKYATDRESNISFDFHGYAMYDFYNQLKDGASVGWEYFGKGTLSAELAVSKSVLIGISDMLYAKRTFYKTYPDVFQIMNSASVYAKWKFR